MSGIFLIVEAPVFVGFMVALQLTGQPPMFERTWLRALGADVWQIRTDRRSCVGRFMEAWGIHLWLAGWDALTGRVDAFELFRAIRETSRNGRY